MKILTELLGVIIMVIAGIIMSLMIAWTIFASVAGVEKLAGRALSQNEMIITYGAFSIITIGSSIFNLMRKRKR